ncbi:MAG TPA: class I lanthipeptide [Chitinophagaceae bacterium]|nr:class I lanthipeptide [Chitinophagaceae bacterium]
MKKQIKKLSLNKKTISNLNTTEMSGKIGGGDTKQGCSGYCTAYCTYSCKSLCGGQGHTCNKPCTY